MIMHNVSCMMAIKWSHSASHPDGTVSPTRLTDDRLRLCSLDRSDQDYTAGLSCTDAAAELNALSYFNCVS